jgi:hypothetical protein
MFIVLSNLTEGKSMNVEGTVNTAPSVAKEHDSEIPRTNPSLRAAAIEAAYILEAVRK